MYVHMLYEIQVLLKVMMNFLIQGLHFTYITSSNVYLLHSLMADMEHYIGAIIISMMRKAQVHKGHK